MKSIATGFSGSIYDDLPALTEQGARKKNGMQYLRNPPLCCDVKLVRLRAFSVLHSLYFQKENPRYARREDISKHSRA